MKLDIISRNMETKGSLNLPKQFSESVRVDVIRRAVEAEQSEKRQRYGASPEAGKRHSAFVSKRRHDYKATYGIGQSRTPRKVVSRNGARMNWVGAFAPQTRGGRQAHPPKADKVWLKKINNKERNLAIRNAISATVSRELVAKRGHILPEKYPFIIEGAIESLQKTKEIYDFLKSIGMEKETTKAEARKIRSGKGKTRGRKYKTKKGPLIITSAECPLLKAAKNIQGLDAVDVSALSVAILAPGAVPGRLTLWTDKAIARLEKESLFV